MKTNFGTMELQEPHQVASKSVIGILPNSHWVDLLTSGHVSRTSSLRPYELQTCPNLI